MKYLCDPHIIPTNTCPPDFSELERRTTNFAQFAREVQLDIADGKFAPVVSWPYQQAQWEELEALVKDRKKLPYADSILYEAHLMLAEPAEIGRLLARAGCKRVICHAEAIAIEDAPKIFESWKEAGAEEVGLSLLIDTPIESIESVVEHCDVVQLMSIAKIGAQGQPFDERAISRAEELHASHPDLMVAVDGGITEAHIEELVRAGANRLCIGSAISKAPDPAAAFSTLYERAMRGCAPLAAQVA